MKTRKISFTVIINYLGKKLFTKNLKCQEILKIFKVLQDVNLKKNIKIQINASKETLYLSKKLGLH